jgi:hypothetical protein
MRPPGLPENSVYALDILLCPLTSGFEAWICTLLGVGGSTELSCFPYHCLLLVRGNIAPLNLNVRGQRGLFFFFFNKFCTGWPCLQGK